MIGTGLESVPGPLRDRNGINGRIDGPDGIAPHLIGDTRTDGTEEASFKDLLTGLVEQVDSLQKDADASIQGLVAGESVNIHDVTIKMEEAGIAFELMMQVRNKLLDAYQQIIKMVP